MSRDLLEAGVVIAVIIAAAALSLFIFAHAVTL